MDSFVSAITLKRRSAVATVNRRARQDNCSTQSHTKNEDSPKDKNIPTKDRRRDEEEPAS